MTGMLDKMNEFVVEKIGGIEKPTGGLVALSISDLTRDSIVFQTAVNLYNPSRIDLPLCEIYYAIKSANRVIVSGTIKDPGSIKSKNSTNIKIPAKVPYDFMISLLTDIGSDGDIDYKVEVTLIIDIPIFWDIKIPLSKSGTIKLPLITGIPSITNIF